MGNDDDEYDDDDQGKNGTSFFFLLRLSIENDGRTDDAFTSKTTNKQQTKQHKTPVAALRWLVQKRSLFLVGRPNEEVYIEKKKKTSNTQWSILYVTYPS